MNNDFDNKLIEAMEDEFSDIEATSYFKANVIKKSKEKATLKALLRKIWNYELELDLRICVVVGLLIIIIPTFLIFEKAEEFKKNEVKYYSEDIR